MWLVSEKIRREKVGSVPTLLLVAFTPRLYFPNIDLKWSISNWLILNAGSRLRQVLPWEHDKKILNGKKTVERIVLLTIQQ
jgi:hypothetical protein